MYLKLRLLQLFLAAASLATLSCKKSTTDTGTTPANTAVVPDIYKKIYGASSITSDGTYIYIKADGTPDHKSAYFNPTNSKYENFSGATFGGFAFSKNPNAIVAQVLTYKIPINPTVASVHSATGLGAIGVAINGVPFFNQYAGGGMPLAAEITSFDQYWGHPSPTNEYHYHVEPLYLTTMKVGKSGLLGFLLDGFPVYGPQEGSVTITNAMLDGYHGHVAATADYPAGIYHYHITSSDPYLNGSGYYGTPGTATR